MEYKQGFSQGHHVWLWAVWRTGDAVGLNYHAKGASWIYTTRQEAVAMQRFYPKIRGDENWQFCWLSSLAPRLWQLTLRQGIILYRTNSLSWEESKEVARSGTTITIKMRKQRFRNVRWPAQDLKGSQWPNRLVNPRCLLLKRSVPTISNYSRGMKIAPWHWGLACWAKSQQIILHLVFLSRELYFLIFSKLIGKQILP